MIRQLKNELEKPKLAKEKGKEKEISDLTLKGIAYHLHSLHHCPLIYDFLQYYHRFMIPYNDNSKPLASPSEAPCKPLPITDTETISETDTETISDKEKKSMRGKTKNPYSPNLNTFELSESITTWANQEYPHIELTKEKEKFLDYIQANGKKYRDLNAAFRNWIRNAHKFQVQQHPPPKTKTQKNWDEVKKYYDKAEKTNPDPKEEQNEKSELYQGNGITNSNNQ